MLLKQPYHRQFPFSFIPCMFVRIYPWSLKMYLGLNIPPSIWTDLSNRIIQATRIQAHTVILLRQRILILYKPARDVGVVKGNSNFQIYNHKIMSSTNHPILKARAWHSDTMDSYPEKISRLPVRITADIVVACILFLLRFVPVKPRA